MSYNDLINIEDFAKRETFTQERWDITFYCKDCKSIVETTRKNPKWYTFICTKCEGTNIAIGTYEGISNQYKIKK